MARRSRGDIAAAAERSSATDPGAVREQSALLDEYAEHMRRYRGTTEKTIVVQRFPLEHFTI